MIHTINLLALYSFGVFFHCAGPRRDARRVNRAIRSIDRSLSRGSIAGERTDTSEIRAFVRKYTHDNRGQIGARFGTEHHVASEKLSERIVVAFELQRAQHGHGWSDGSMVVLLMRCEKITTESAEP